MTRILKRVALDFDWPLHRPWKGYISHYNQCKCEKFEQEPEHQDFCSYAQNKDKCPFYYDPPSGEGYQMWETTSEGSPITPVFEDPDELVKHIYNNDLFGFGLFKKVTRKAAQSYVYSNGPSLHESKGLKLIDPTGGKIPRTILPLTHFFDSLHDAYLDKKLINDDFEGLQKLIQIYVELHTTINNLSNALIEHKELLPDKVIAALEEYRNKNGSLYKDITTIQEHYTKKYKKEASE